MRIMALVAGKLCLHTEACVPCTVAPAVSACFPVTVGRAMAFSAEQDELIAGYFSAIVIYICIQIRAIVAVETAEI